MVDQFQSQNSQMPQQPNSHTGSKKKNIEQQDEQAFDGEIRDDESKRGGLFDSQKEKLMSGLDTVSSVIKTATDELRKDGATSMIADYAEKLGGNMGDVKEWVSDLNLEKAMQATREFARRRPEVVLLGMFGAGLLVGRFLKASSGAINATSTNSEQNVKGYPLTSIEVH